jgi:hypothetical protein
VVFCTPFDEALAGSGPAAVFLFDQEGALRFEATWTRDAWGRAPGPHDVGHTWLLARDAASGFVWVVLATSPTLLVDHPRLQLRVMASLEAARAALDAFGRPPVASEPW